MYQAAGLQAEGLDLARFDAITLFRLLRLIYRLRIQLVHWNFYHPLNGYLWALTVLAPWVEHWFTDHISRAVPISHPASGMKKAVKGMLLRRYSKVLCVSQFVLDCLKTEGTWANLSRCVHIINTDRFIPDQVQRSCIRNKTNAEDLFVVLAVAYLIRPKGIDVAIRALTELPEHIVLWVIGDGTESQRPIGVDQRVVVDKQGPLLWRSAKCGTLHASGGLSRVPFPVGRGRWAGGPRGAGMRATGDCERRWRNTGIPGG